MVAMICSEPPAGLTRWTISLVVHESISRGICDTVSDEIILRLRHRHESKPWREENVERTLVKF